MKEALVTIDVVGSFVDSETASLFNCEGSSENKCMIIAIKVYFACQVASSVPIFMKVCVKKNKQALQKLLSIMKISGGKLPSSAFRSMRVGTNQVVANRVTLIDFNSCKGLDPAQSCLDAIKECTIKSENSVSMNNWYLYFYNFFLILI